MDYEEIQDGRKHMAFSIPVGFWDIQLNLAEYHQQVKGSGGSRIGFRQWQLPPVLPCFWQHALSFVHVLGAVLAGSLIPYFPCAPWIPAPSREKQGPTPAMECLELPARPRCRVCRNCCGEALTTCPGTAAPRCSSQTCLCHRDMGQSLP